MITKILRILFYLCSLAFLIYLAIPTPEFPPPPPNSPQSQEPGDLTDLDNRKAYFTNLSREEIRQHYQSEFKHPGIFSNIPSINFQNYPKEESQWHVYKPLLSSYLEEHIYPFRESFFVSYFEPGPNEDKLAHEGTPYPIKITVRYYQSSLIARLLLGLTTISAIYLVSHGWSQQVVALFRNGNRD